MFLRFTAPLHVITSVTGDNVDTVNLALFCTMVFVR